MMRQYARIKEKHRDAVLFFRLGDFYEMFRHDAEDASRILGLTLTQRQGVPMCGVPHHASRGYIARLLQAGRKVAICEQTKPPDGTKGLADRDVVEVISPGTATDEDYLNRAENSFLLVLSESSKGIEFAYADVSTGTLSVGSIPDTERTAGVRGLLARLRPREILSAQSLAEADDACGRALCEMETPTVERIPDWHFDRHAGFELLCRALNVVNLKGFGISEDAGYLAPAGVLLHYVADSTGGAPYLTRGVTVMDAGNDITLDESTLRNLEVVQGIQDAGRRFSLLGTMDSTRSSMGARLLSVWLTHPLTDLSDIRSRHEAVRALYRGQSVLSDLRRELSSVSDLERLATRISLGRAHGKDMKAVQHTLQQVEQIQTLVGLLNTTASEQTISLLSPVASDAEYAAVRSIADEIERAIVDNPATVEHEGNLIRPESDTELHTLHTVHSDGERLMQELLQRERERSGISTLKLRYNRVIGYFFEATRAQADQIPHHFRRRQSMANAERFTTDELVELERSRVEAAERIVEVERALFVALRERVAEHVAMLSRIGHRIAALDVLAAFAYNATVKGYVEPEMTDDACLEIEAGRHPVVEAHVSAGEFVPNDVSLSPEETSFILLTGPNMAGKSTFLRQVALTVLLAQAGSFVPARRARIGVADRIFCRVGASDNLARGESTFLVEMNETAYILNRATRDSLIIMDEVGRGTGTEDGLSIAQATSEFILSEIGCRTLFATHYHQLTGMRDRSLSCMCMAVEEKDNRIRFLKQVVPGAAERSYGIHVAELAGIPSPVIRRANELLSRRSVQTPDSAAHPQPESVDAPVHADRGVALEFEPNLFPSEQIAADEIRSAELESTTPIDALLLLKKLQQQLQSK